MQTNIDTLYGQVPDKLYTWYDDAQVWYAFYDDALSVLTNANGDLEIFEYCSKTDYRDVRRIIISTYNVRETRVFSYDEFN